MPKSHPRRNAAEARSGFSVRPVFAGFAIPWPRRHTCWNADPQPDDRIEMAVGQSRQAQSACPRASRNRGADAPATIVPIAVTATPAAARPAAERLEAGLAGSRTGSRNRRRRITIASMPTTPRASNARGRRPTAECCAASMAADTPDAAQSLARSPARPSDTSIAALAWSRTAFASALRGCGTR